MRNKILNIFTKYEYSKELIYKAILSSVWVLFGIWLIYSGIDIFIRYSMLTGLFKFFPIPIEHPIEKILLGIFSLIIAGIILKNREDKIQYLFVFLGFVLIFIALDNAILFNGGFGLLLPFFFLLKIKKLKHCLFLFLVILMFFIAIHPIESINYFRAIGSFITISGILIFASYMMQRQRKSLFQKIEIKWEFRLMLLLIGLIPGLIARFTTYEDFIFLESWFN